MSLNAYCHYGRIHETKETIRSKGMSVPTWSDRLMSESNHSYRPKFEMSVVQAELA